MTVWLSYLLALARHGLRETMVPWLAVSVSLHAGLIAAILPEREELSLNAGGAIAVDIVLVEGPDARSAMATGETGDMASRPGMARKAERRDTKSTASEPVAEPVADPAPPVAPEPAPAQTAAVAAKAPPATSAPVILAPRPRRKPAPPPVRPAAQPDAPASPAMDFDTDEESAEIAAVTPDDPASSTALAGGSRGASPQPGNPKPVYPYSARRQGRQGRVVLRVEVRPDGAAGAVSVDQTSGDVRLDKAAVAAVRKWRFRPAQRNGMPIAANVRVPIRFSLR